MSSHQDNNADNDETGAWSKSTDVQTVKLVQNFFKEITCSSLTCKFHEKGKKKSLE